MRPTFTQRNKKLQCQGWLIFVLFIQLPMYLQYLWVLSGFDVQGFTDVAPLTLVGIGCIDPVHQDENIW